jgi:transketolase
MQAIARGAKEEAAWKANCVEYSKKYPKEFQEFVDLTSGEG